MILKNTSLFLIYFLANFLHAMELEPSNISFFEHPKLGCFGVDLSSDAVLGEGRNGQVRKAILNDGTQVAIKIQSQKFDKEEIKACEQAGYLVGSALKIKLNDGWKYTYLQKFIDGVTLDKWLLEHVPPHLFSGTDSKKYFTYLTNLIEHFLTAMHEQVHEKLMAFNDANIKNIMIDSDNKIHFIDYGNAFVFTKRQLKNKNMENLFTAYRDQDYLMLETAFFIFLKEENYPTHVQDTLWKKMFLETRLNIKVHQFENSPFEHTDAVSFLYALCDGLMPEFLNMYSKEQILSTNLDEEVANLIHKN